MRLQKILLSFLLLFGSTNGAEHPSYVSSSVWKMLEPYLIPESHPVKRKLDKIFSKNRVLENNRTLHEAGFVNPFPLAHSKAIVIRHKEIPGYIFKIYLDSKKDYFHGEPEYISWMQRAEGARLVRAEIAKQGWKGMFKVPKKWIYPLPEKPKGRKKDLKKHFILVEDEMDVLPDSEIRKKWKDGTITKVHLDRIFHLMHTLGLRGGSKHDNIPICRDGRIAYIDTQNYSKWPLPYSRLFHVLDGELYTHWRALMDSADDVDNS